MVRSYQNCAITVAQVFNVHMTKVLGIYFRGISLDLDFWLYVLKIGNASNLFHPPSDWLGLNSKLLKSSYHCKQWELEWWNRSNSESVGQIVPLNKTRCHCKKVLKNLLCLKKIDQPHSPNPTIQTVAAWIQFRERWSDRSYTALNLGLEFWYVA